MQAVSSAKEPTRDGSLTFRASTPRAALDQVKLALGKEAVILSCRETGSMLGGRQVEVVARREALVEPEAKAPEPPAAASEEEPDPSALVDPLLTKRRAAARAAVAFAPNRPGSLRTPTFAEALREREKERRQPRDQHWVDALRGTSPDEPTPWADAGPDATPPSPTVDELVMLLEDRGLERPVAERVVELSGAAGRQDSLLRLRRAAAQMITTGRAPWTPDPTSERSVVALVGPTGVGKTTTAVKIAGRAMLERGLSTALITLDVHRIGATTQLLGYADAMGVDAYVAKDVSSFEDALARSRDVDLLIIDTAGRSPNDLDILRHQGALLDRCPNVEVNLVVPATCCGRHLELVRRQYDRLVPTRLLVSKVDEAWGSAAVFNVASQVPVPLVAVTDGQGIPEDVHASRDIDLFGWIDRPR